MDVIIDAYLVAVGLLALVGLLWLCWQFWTGTVDDTVVQRIGVLLIVLAFVGSQNVHQRYVSTGRAGDVLTGIVPLLLLGVGLWLLVPSRTRDRLLSRS